MRSDLVSMLDLQVQPSMARELFAADFVSCWNSLTAAINCHWLDHDGILLSEDACPAGTAKHGQGALCCWFCLLLG